MRNLVRAAALVAVVACVAGPAQAWSGRAAWTTWLRAGPGLQFTVTDEISRDDPLEVLGCDGGWCRAVYGNVAGYVQAELIARIAAPPMPPAAASGAENSCFDAKEAGYKDGKAFHYCPR